MSPAQKLTLEILNGPLDGAEITLESETKWTRLPNSLLSFPWDDELGEPQANFRPEASTWTLEGLSGTQHGTYIINRKIKVSDPELLKSGDLLRAHYVFLGVV